MILNGPPLPPGVTAYSVTFDLLAHTYTIVYGPIAGPAKTITGTIPAGVLTQVETAVQRQIEADQGWANGSSTVVTP